MFGLGQIRSVNSNRGNWQLMSKFLKTVRLRLLPSTRAIAKSRMCFLLQTYSAGDDTGQNGHDQKLRPFELTVHFLQATNTDKCRAEANFIPIASYQLSGVYRPETRYA